MVLDSVYYPGLHQHSRVQIGTSHYKKDKMHSPAENYQMTEGWDHTVDTETQMEAVFKCGKENVEEMF